MGQARVQPCRGGLYQRSPAVQLMRILLSRCGACLGANHADVVELVDTHV